MRPDRYTWILSEIVMAIAVCYALLAWSVVGVAVFVVDGSHRAWCVAVAAALAWLGYALALEAGWEPRGSGEEDPHGQR